MNATCDDEHNHHVYLRPSPLTDSTFTWLVVAVVAASCFLTVVSIFLYVLFKPKKKRKMDYILARQSSVFSE